MTSATVIPHLTLVRLGDNALFCQSKLLLLYSPSLYTVNFNVVMFTDISANNHKSVTNVEIVCYIFD